MKLDYNDPEIFQTIPEDEYHAESRNGHYMSSHLLQTFKDSPLQYKRIVEGLAKQTDSAAFAFGRAAHCFILEHKEFDSRYCVSDGPVNPKTGEVYGKMTKAYAEWRCTEPRQVVSTKDMDMIDTMDKAIYRENRWARLALSEGVPERVVRATYHGVPCQIRMDWFTGDAIVDLKTCDQLKWFESDIRKYGYIYQLAFYREVIHAATGFRPEVTIIAVEKSEPNSAGVWAITENVLDEAAKFNEAALSKYSRCVSEDLWPTNWDTIRTITEL